MGPAPAAGPSTSAGAAAGLSPMVGGWRWRVQLLGDVQLRDARGVARGRLPSRAVVALLARLAMAPQRAHPREELVELLWPGVALDIGRNRLRQVLSTLKSLLEPAEAAAAGPVILADRAHLRVAPGALACDVLEFEAAVRARRREAAFECYRGPLMPGHFDEWVLEERQRLEALADRMDFASLAPPAQAAPAAPATPEANAANTAEAASTALSMPVTRAAGASALPTYLTRLLGAEASVAGLLALVPRQRLLTVLGPGGCGKTRLAVEVAARLADAAGSARSPSHSPGHSPGHSLGQSLGQSLGHSPGQSTDPSPGPSPDALPPTAPFDLVLFVSLVPAHTAEGVREALAQALQAEARPAALRAALDGRRALLVLDNCEQAADAVAAELGPLLAHLPLLQVLATSRRALGLDGEHLVQQGTLPLPEAGEPLSGLAANPAVALFVDRARSARADFHLHEGNAAAVAALVRWLDGMPLAIELAAARVRALGPAQMLALLQADPQGGALALVSRAGPRSGADARHASMPAVVAWSWDLLSADARGALADLALFPGGFTLEALQAVAGCTLIAAAARLDELVDHSMLRAHADGERFSMLEVIREFALATLAPARAAQVRQRQRQWLLQWARGLPATPSLRHLQEEMPNIVAALESATPAGAAAEAVELLVLLRRCFEDVALPAAGLRALQTAIQACVDAGDLAAAGRGHTGIAPLLYQAGDSAGAGHHAQAGLQAARDTGAAPALLAKALHTAASVRWRSTRQVAACLPLLDEAEPLAASAGALDVQASLLALRAFMLNQQARGHAQAEALYEQALAHWRALGNEHAVNSGLYNLAVVAMRAGADELALARVQQVVASAQRLGDARRIRQALNVRGNAQMGLRRWGAASDTLRDCVRLSWAAMAPHDLAYGLWNLPRPLAHLRQPQPALRIAAFAARYWGQHFGGLSAQDERDLRLVQRLARLFLPAPRVQALWLQGEQASLAETVALALATHGGVAEAPGANPVPLSDR